MATLERTPGVTGGESTLRLGEAGYGAAGRRSDEATVVLYSVEPAGGAEGKGIAGFALEAETVLGRPVKIRWGHESGRWYSLSVSSLKR